MPAPKTAPRRQRAIEKFLTYPLGLLVKLTDQATASRFESELGLSLSDARGLMIIGAEQPVRVQSLADFGSIDKSQASRVAASLVGQGLATRTDDANDRRSSSISLTAAGRRRYERGLKIAQARNREIVSVLSAAEREKFEDMVWRLVEAARKQSR